MDKDYEKQKGPGISDRLSSSPKTSSEKFLH